MQQRLLAGACLTMALGCAWADDDARTWLDRMNRALATRNYDGTFIHFRAVDGGRVDMLRIIHSVESGRVAERLVSMDSRREIVRDGGELTCYLPDQKRVLVEPLRDRGALLGT